MLISLIVPVYNLEAYLEETLRSVAVARRNAGLSDGEIETICIDDGSSDSSGAILDEHARRGEIVVIHQPNGGEGAARNAGLARARGAFLMFLDGDDVLLPNALACAVRLIREFPAADIFNMRFRTFDDGAAFPEASEDDRPRCFKTEREIPAELVCRLGVFPSLFRRESFAAFRFTALPLGADRAYVLTCLAAAKAAVLSEAVVGGYRQRGGSMAHARWTGAKIRSLNDHAILALEALASSGKRIAAKGAAYMASLVLSEVPARIARLGDTADVAETWSHWIASLDRLPRALLPPAQRIVCGMIGRLAFSRGASVMFARLCRFLNIS